MRASIIISFLASTVLASATITTTTQIGGLCWVDSTAPASTQTQAANTATVTEPGTLSLTTTKYVYYTGAAKRYPPPPQKKRETTIVVSDVCASTTTLVLTPTATSFVATSTTTTTVSQYTTVLTPTYTLCAPGNQCG